MNPIISVIIPVYNAEKTIQRCIESVLNQTYSSFELILIDDGSTDGSGKQCDYYSETDERIRVFHQDNKGVSEARNAGLAQVSGRYVFFLDSDDELYSETLEKYLEIISRYDADALLGSLDVVCYFGKSKIGFKNEIIYGKDIWEDICMNPQPFGYIGKMYKADIAKQIQFNKNMISQEDLDYNLEIFNRCNLIAATSFAGYRYYQFGNQRKLQILDYIKNQIKLYDYAEANCQISDASKRAVLDRITALAYTALYNTTSIDEYNDLADKISSIQAIGKHSGEFKSLKVKHAFFMERIIKKECLSTYIYCRARKKVADSMRLLKQ